MELHRACEPDPQARRLFHVRCRRRSADRHARAGRQHRRVLQFLPASRLAASLGPGELQADPLPLPRLGLRPERQPSGDAARGGGDGGAQAEPRPAPRAARGRRRIPVRDDERKAAVRGRYVRQSSQGMVGL